MKLEQTASRVIVTLSKRNLLALLVKVDDKDSAKTIFTDEYLLATGKRLVVKAEPDAKHYDRPYPPGRMHPKAEQFIAKNSYGDVAGGTVPSDVYDAQRAEETS